MYAIAVIQGFQFKLEQDKWLLVPRMQVKEGEIVTIHEVLAYQNEHEMLLGTPFVENVNVRIRVLESLVKAQKLIVFKMKKRKRYRRKKGHRQQLTKIFIEEIVRS